MQMKTSCINLKITMALWMNGNSVCINQTAQNSSLSKHLYILFYALFDRDVWNQTDDLHYRNTWETAQYLFSFLPWNRNNNETIQKAQSDEKGSRHRKPIVSGSGHLLQSNNTPSRQHLLWTLKLHRFWLHCLGFHFIFRSREKSDKFSHTSFRPLLC